MNERCSTLFRTIVAVVLVLSASASYAQDQLVLGLPSYRSATTLYKRFGPLVGHLSRELNMQVTIHSETDYELHSMNLKNGTVDIAFMGPALYALYTKQFGNVPLLAAFETNGKRTYKGYIVVQKNSTITRLSQLKGKKVAFGDSKSTMGHIVPHYLMLQSGVDLNRLAGHKFLDNQENVALGVLSGNFDAGGVREDIYNQYAGEGLRIIASSEPMPDHLFVARTGLPKDKVDKIRKIFLSLKDTEEGRKVLRSLQGDLTALVPINNAEYDPLRAILERLMKTGVTL